MGNIVYVITFTRRNPPPPHLQLCVLILIFIKNYGFELELFFWIFFNWWALVGFTLQ
jgi:hypothetical protein